MIPHLRASKPKKCREVLTEYRLLVWPEALRGDAARLDEWVCRYRFREALDLLMAIRARCEVDKE